MSAGRWGRIVVGGVVVAGAVVLVRSLRGPAAPQFSRHPSVDGGPVEPGLASLVAPVAAPVEAVAAIEPEAVEVAAPAAAPSAGANWVAPVEGGCPEGYPIKAKLKSGIYHQPGGLAYDRTNPDRCYPDAATAEADGLRAAKR